MSSIADLQSGFARAVEAEYARRVATHEGAGVSPEDAHQRALEEAKELGRTALEELRRRGLFPWWGAEPKWEGGPRVLLSAQFPWTPCWRTQPPGRRRLARKRHDSRARAR